MSRLFPSEGREQLNPETATKRPKKYKNQGLTERTFSEEFGDIITLDEAQAEVSFWKSLFTTFCGTYEVQLKNNYLYFESTCGLCLIASSDQHLVFKMRKAGLERLDQFLCNSSKREILKLDMKLLTWSCLSLLSYFYLRNLDKGCCNRPKKKRYTDAKELFHNAMYLVLPERQGDVVKFMIEYFRVNQRWCLEEFVTLSFQEMMVYVTRKEFLLAKLLRQIEKNKKERLNEEAYKLTASLAVILERTVWENYLLNDRLHNCFNAMLKLYLIHNTDDPATKKFNVKIRTEIKNCIKYFVINMKENKGLVSMMDSVAKCLHDPSIPEEDRIDLCDVICLCAQRHEAKLYRETLTPDLFTFLLANLKSSNKNLVLLSHKILQNLLDRQGNLKNFSDPVYYFKGGLNVRVAANCDLEDAYFFKTYIAQLFEGMTSSFMNFMEKNNLVMYYTTICILLVEVPEPYTTINIIHVIITIQDSILKVQYIPMAAKAHVHAVLASIMSLICVIHTEEVVPLRKYVEKVLSFRTENAPFLLPPLFTKYTVASHHTTEYHDQLYFLEDEILFALQRCWLGKRVLAQKMLKSLSKPENISIEES